MGNHGFKTVKKRKKQSVSKNNTSGEVRTEVLFEDELEEIKAVDDSISPMVMCGQVKVEHQNSESTSRPSEQENSTAGIPRDREKTQI